MSAPFAGRLKQGQDPFVILLHDYDQGPIDSATYGANPFWSEWYDVGAWRQMAAFENIIQVSGFGEMSIWLQATIDDHDSQPDEDLWRAFDIPTQKQDQTIELGSDRTAHINGRQVLKLSATNPGRGKNIYDRVPWRYVRFMAQFTGGTFAFRLVLKGK